nr:DUF1493 family protein [Candidatus Thiosymbion oneisti]
MRTNSSGSWQQLLHFVEQERGKYRVPLTSDTELFAQLGLESDDALEFLDHYATEFCVDMTGFDYHLYFGPEGLDVISIIASLFSGKGRQPYKPLMLGDLHDAMIRGRWEQEPV